MACATAVLPISGRLTCPRGLARHESSFIGKTLRLRSPACVPKPLLKNLTIRGYSRKELQDGSVLFTFSSSDADEEEATSPPSAGHADAAQAEPSHTTPHAGHHSDFADTSHTKDQHVASTATFSSQGQGLRAAQSRTPRGEQQNELPRLPLINSLTAGTPFRFHKRSPIPPARARALAMSEAASTLHANTPPPPTRTARPTPAVPRPTSAFQKRSPVAGSLGRAGVPFKRGQRAARVLRESSRFRRRSAFAAFKLRELQKAQEQALSQPAALPLRERHAPAVPRPPSLFLKKSPLMAFRLWQQSRPRHSVQERPVTGKAARSIPARLPSRFTKASPILVLRLQAARANPAAQQRRTSVSQRKVLRPLSCFLRQSPVLASKARKQLSPAQTFPLDTPGSSSDEEGAVSGSSKRARSRRRSSIAAILAPSGVKTAVPAAAFDPAPDAAAVSVTLTETVAPAVPPVPRLPSRCVRQSPVRAAQLRAAALSPEQGVRLRLPQRQASSFTKQSPVTKAARRGGKGPNGRWIGAEPPILRQVGPTEVLVVAATDEHSNSSGEESTPLPAGKRLSRRAKKVASSAGVAETASELSPSATSSTAPATAPEKLPKSSITAVSDDSSDESGDEGTISSSVPGPERQPSKFKRRRRPLPTSSGGLPSPSQVPMGETPNGTVVHNRIPMAQPLGAQTPAFMEGWTGEDASADGLMVGAGSTAPASESAPASAPAPAPAPSGGETEGVRGELEGEQLEGREGPARAEESDPVPEAQCSLEGALGGVEGGNWTREFLSGLKVAELRERAKSAGLRGFSRMKKAELVEALLSAGGD